MQHGFQRHNEQGCTAWTHPGYLVKVGLTMRSHRRTSFTIADELRGASAMRSLRTSGPKPVYNTQSGTEAKGGPAKSKVYHLMQPNVCSHCTKPCLVAGEQGEIASGPETASTISARDWLREPSGPKGTSLDDPLGVSPCDPPISCQ